MTVNDNEEKLEIKSNGENRYGKCAKERIYG